MKIDKVTALDYPVNSVPFLKGVEQGYDVDIRTPLFKGESREVVAEEWACILEKLEPRMVDELSDLEWRQRAKIGSISRRKPFSGRYQDVEAYFLDRAAPEYDFSEIRDMLERNNTNFIADSLSRRLRPITYEKAASQLPHNTNSGLPHFKKRRDVLEQSIALAKGSTYYPAMLGWRGSSGQTGEYYPKQRVVCMASFSHNIREARFQQVYHQVMLKEPQYFAALQSMDEVDKQVTWLFDNLPEEAYIMCTDYAKYDQSLQEQQKWFFQRLKDIFQPNTLETLGDLEYHARNWAILCTTEVMYSGAGGWGSGMNFTNACESTVNRDAQCSSPVALVDAFQLQGDDSMGRIWKPDLHLKHLEKCGFDLNSDKQTVSRKAAIYLQRLHHIEYRVDGILRGQYPTMRALNSLLGMERFHANWDKDLEAMRTLSILENCKWHVCFREFVDFVVKRGDLYLKEFVASLDNRTNGKVQIAKARAIPGFVPTYNQVDSMAGLQLFESVRLIRNM